MLCAHTHQCRRRCRPLNIEPIGEKEFVDALRKSGSMWVGWNEGSVLVAPASGEGNSVYTWTDYEKAQEYLLKREPECRPVEVPLNVLCNVWLHDSAMNIQEVIANAHPNLDMVLSFSRLEILESLGST